MNKADLKIKTAQIGQCGVLLLQYKLLQRGVESAPMTTDSGIDLVAYSPRKSNAVTIQVKTNFKPKPGGGKGRDAVDWRIPVKSPAQYVALVNLKSEQIWFFRHSEMAASSQQTKNGRHHFYMYIDDDVKTRTGKAAHCFEFKKFLLENRIHEVFGV